MSAGAERIKSMLAVFNRTPSEFGLLAADLLDDLYIGIYHLDQKTLMDVKWENPTVIRIAIKDNRQMATADESKLTRLVFLAHHYGVRASIEAASGTKIQIVIWKVSKKDFIIDRHPTLQEALASFERLMFELHKGDSKNA